jgi:DNA-binding transcriptional LysR family regulator
VDGIENLRTFVAVADAQSLSGAARRLGIAASVATKRIDQLERKVRTRLFTRSTRRVRLTEFGALYLSPARRLIHDYDEVLAGMSRSLRQIEGSLRIKVPTPLAVAHMAEVLAKFQQQFPLLSLDIVLADRAVNPLEEGFDIAIHGLANSFPGVIDEPLFPLHRLVCAAPAYLERRAAPKHPRELVQHDCLMHLPAGTTWTFESVSGLVSIELRPKLSANDSLVLTAAAIQGNGIALLPMYAIARALRSGSLVRVLEPFTVPSVWIRALVPENRASIPRVRSLVTFLKAHYSPVPPWDRNT